MEEQKNFTRLKEHEVQAVQRKQIEKDVDVLAVESAMKKRGL